MIGPTLLELVPKVQRHYPASAMEPSGGVRDTASLKLAQISRHCKPEQSLKAIISLSMARKSDAGPSTLTGCLR